MKGNIYTDHKCPVCGGTLRHDERRGGCFCVDHPKIAATGRFYVRFGRDIAKRFERYDVAIRFLTGLRYKSDEGTFDAQDYAAGNPMSFRRLAERYLDHKRRQGLATFDKIDLVINRAIDRWCDDNIKTVGMADIEDWVYGIPDVGDKTRHNHITILHGFYRWLKRSRIVEPRYIPEMPVIEYELAFRKIIDIETRETLLEEIRRRTMDKPKAYLAVDMLCSYAQLRPGDLLRLTEGDIDVEAGVVTFWRPTKSKKRKAPRVIRLRLLEAHTRQIADIKSRWPALPHVKFFRHIGGKGVLPGQPWDEGYLYKWVWRPACEALGIEGLDLYGGTRHSSTTALAKAVGRDRARKFSGHETNIAFDRYCQVDDDSAAEAIEMARIRGKVIPLAKKTGAE